MRDLTFEISVKGAEQAEAAVAKVEQRMVAAGRAGEQASVGVQKFEQAAQRTSGTVVQADRATQALQQSTVATTRSMGTLTTATTAAGTATTKTTGSLYEQVKAMIAADVAAMQMTSATEAATVAQTGLFAQVSAGITKFAPYAVAAQVVVGILVDWYEAHEKAAVAAETLAAKQDTIARASKLAGTTIRTYGDAVKYMNEQFQRTPAFVDNASDALSHWNIAVQKGPLNARNFAAGDLLKNIGDAAKTVQDQLSRIGMDTAQKAMDLLREKTVLGSAAFNQWAKDIGLSSVTIDVLREQVQAEERAEQNYQRTLDRTTRATNSRTEATKAAVISMKELADVTAMRYRAGGTVLQEIIPFEGPPAPDDEVLPPSTAERNLALLKHVKEYGKEASTQLQEAADSGREFRTELDDLATAMTQLATVSGDSFNGVARDLANIIVSWNAASKAAEAYKESTTLAGKAAAVTAGIAAVAQATGSGSRGSRIIGGGLAGAQAGSMFGPWGMAIGAGVGALTGYLRSNGPSQRELEGRDAQSNFQQRFGSFENMTNSLGEAYAVVTGNRNDAQAAVLAMLNAEKQGADAVNAAIKNLQATMDHAATIKQGAAQFGMSQTELNQAAATANEVYEYMVRMQQQGEYSQEQVNRAYFAWQKAMADAGNEAAKAWVEAQSAAKAGASGPISAMQSEMDRLRASIANEAPEDVKGVIETQVEGQIAALKAQMDEQQRAMADSAKTGAEDAVTEIKDTFSDLVLHVPVIYDFPRVQGLPQPEIPEPVPMADGGIGRVTKPTLFLAGEAGPEDFAFSGGNRSFAPAGRSNAGGAPVTVNVVLNNPAFDTPAGRRRTMDQIGQAMVEALRREGRMVV
jgi:hypothetical protein